MNLRLAALYLALWTPLVLVYAILIGTPNALSVGEAVGGALLTVGMAAVLGLPTIWWTRRLAARQASEDSPTLPWAPMPWHALGAVLYSAAWAAFIVDGIRGSLGSWDAVVRQVRPWIAWQLFFGIVVYAVVAGITWALLSRARATAREARLREVESQRTRAELAMLRARVDPHFLYNGLHTATALVRRDPAAAENALEQLAALLRYVLDPDRGARELVPLDEELRFVDLYLAIERARLGDRLRVDIHVDDEARDMLVPSLSLQPLVENAIRHGVAPSTTPGTITVTGVLDGGRLVLSVHDDGATAGGVLDTSGTGVGLDALRRRLTAWYQGKATLHAAPTTPRGFTVTMSLPT